MTRLRWFQNIRTAISVLLFGSIAAAVVAVFWINHNGLPASWRLACELQIERSKGLHIQLGDIKYELFRGIVAHDVRIYDDARHTREIARLERLVLDMDKAKLLQGDASITRFEFKDAHLALPLDPGHDDSKVLEISALNGTVLMPTGRLIELRDGSGMIGGLIVQASARLQDDRASTGQDNPNDDHGFTLPRDLIRKILEEFNRWTLDPAKHPKLRVFVEGDLADPSTIHATARFDGSSLEKNGYEFRNLSAEGDFSGKLITITSVHAEDGGGKLDGRCDFDLGRREGRFDATCDVRLPHLLRALFDVPGIQDISFGSTPRIEAAGDIRLPADRAPIVRATGHLACGPFMARGVPLDSLDTAFAWNDGKLYCRDIIVTGEGCAAHGKVLVDGTTVRYALSTTLPLAMYRPFFKDQPLGHVLHDFVENKHTNVFVDLEGSADVIDHSAWTARGRARLEHVTYRGTPARSVSANLDLCHEQLDFTNGDVVFDCTDYPLRKSYQATSEGALRVKRVRYDRVADQVEIEQIAGTMWPSPVIRVFQPRLADDLEIYRFQSPPDLTCSGLVDLGPHNRTDLHIGLRGVKAMDYVFVGKTLTLVQPTANVRVRESEVAVDNLKFRVFDGPVDAAFLYNPARNGGTLHGELSWTRLSMPSIASTYQIRNKAGGLVTGRIEFTGPTNGVRQLNGKGLVSLERAELFSVPILGPLSPLVAGILGDRHAGFEQARDAFFTYHIEDGILHTYDFRTLTTSIAFTGDAAVDLDQKTMEMTMRMNARGLLGLVILPLRPFAGLFQFRGTGPLDQPKWENVMFTSPPEEQKSNLLNPPKARLVPEL